MSGWDGQAGQGGGMGAGGPAGAPLDTGPLREIAFTDEETGNMRAMARWMSLAGILLLVTSLLQIVVQVTRTFIAPIIHDLPSQATTAKVGGLFCGALIGIGLAIVLGGSLIAAGRAFKRVVDTNDADQANLADGFRKLRTYFLVKGILVIAVFLLCCVGTIVGAAAFTALR